MIAGLRRELRLMLEDIPSSRTPSVRRCEHPDALLAVNLPFLANGAATARFIRTAQAQGWTVVSANGWLLLDHPVPVPEAPQPLHFDGETGCLLSLLTRHPDDKAPCTAEIRALVKAAEESPAAVIRLCAAMHRDWAVRLRNRQPLPGGLAPYLQYVHHHFFSNKEGTP